MTSLCYKKQVHFKSRAHKANQLLAEEVYTQNECKCSQSDFTSSDEIQSVQTEAKFPKTSYLVTNLAYKLKPHLKENSTWEQDLILAQM